MDSSPFEEKLHPKVVRKTSFLKSHDAMIESLLPIKEGVGIRRMTMDVTPATTSTVRRVISIGERMDLLDETIHRRSLTYVSLRSVSSQRSVDTANDMDRSKRSEMDQPISQRQRLKSQESPIQSHHKSIPSPTAAVSCTDTSPCTRETTSERTISTESSEDVIVTPPSEKIKTKTKPVPPAVTNEQLVVDLKIHLLNSIKEQSTDELMNNCDTERNSTPHDPLSTRSENGKTFSFTGFWSKVVKSIKHVVGELDGHY